MTFHGGDGAVGGVNEQGVGQSELPNDGEFRVVLYLIRQQVPSTRGPSDTARVIHICGSGGLADPKSNAIIVPWTPSTSVHPLPHAVKKHPKHIAPPQLPLQYLIIQLKSEHFRRKAPLPLMKLVFETIILAFMGKNGSMMLVKPWPLDNNAWRQILDDGALLLGRARSERLAQSPRQRQQASVAVYGQGWGGGIGLFWGRKAQSPAQILTHEKADGVIEKLLEQQSPQHRAFLFPFPSCATHYSEYKRHFHGQNHLGTKKIWKESVLPDARGARGLALFSSRIPAVWADVFGSFVRCQIGEIRCPQRSSLVSLAGMYHQVYSSALK
ncbi:hypothetical protein THAOC_16098 [Thalassiosira oceanica]|uniref:Uncharacterized protein n=1 Tax=Thalassiosira oceanica TaxID=159749 RepID=K0SD36_THAOC|nr:hypothetical protein THAOC_16098 [Thalassiosira oceanica]|eukprot:EJK63255.1 hypothetical protein THAOC_16098 [Thalassiosira oceanica]